MGYSWPWELVLLLVSLVSLIQPVPVRLAFLHSPHLTSSLCAIPLFKKPVASGSSLPKVNQIHTCVLLFSLQAIDQFPPLPESLSWLLQSTLMPPVLSQTSMEHMALLHSSALSCIPVCWCSLFIGSCLPDGLGSSWGRWPRFILLLWSSSSSQHVEHTKHRSLSF